MCISLDSVAVVAELFSGAFLFKKKTKKTECHQLKRSALNDTAALTLLLRISFRRIAIAIRHMFVLVPASTLFFFLFFSFGPLPPPPKNPVKSQ